MDRDSTTGKLNFLFEEADDEADQGLLLQWPEPYVLSTAASRFWNLLHALSPEVPRLALKNYRLWLQNSNQR